jgi:hypothetical protein
VTDLKPRKRGKKGKKEEEKSPFSFWAQFKIIAMLWFARISAVIWAYMYHDWQAVPLLIFVAHSSFYTNRDLFQEFLVYFYCPYALIYMLWMFIINIPGVYNFSTDETKLIEMYNYGFYPYDIPILE